MTEKPEGEVYWVSLGGGRQQSDGAGSTRLHPASPGQLAPPRSALVLALLVTHAAEPVLASPRPAHSMTVAHVVDDCTAEVNAQIFQSN
ncbi:MAG: hypothetical protein FRX49_12478 [Trebouxia sp. A1-2]|nr:MAG: hypothetical protein FRX49_12478 [Trebouxia sp. A1-2]